MSAKSGEQPDQTPRPSGKDVLVHGVDPELYSQFCERTVSLGVDPDSVLLEVLTRGMTEWIRMRSG